jgi:hypothetical protein
VPLGELAQATGAAFDWLAAAVVSPSPLDGLPGLDKVLEAVDGEYDQLREARASSAFAAAEILRFCTFFFNLKEVTHGLRAMEGVLAGEGKALIDG